MKAPLNFQNTNHFTEASQKMTKTEFMLISSNSHLTELMAPILTCSTEMAASFIELKSPAYIQ